MSFALGLLKPNRRNRWHISHGIIVFEVSAHWLVELIVITMLFNIRITVGRVLSLLDVSRLLVAKHRFIQIKVILSIPLLQLLIEIRVSILIVRMTLIEHFKIRDAEVALVNIQRAKSILTRIFLRIVRRKMHCILIPLFFELASFIRGPRLETQWRIIRVMIRRNMS